ncbi:hypothetical protein [Bacillus sp. FJAT-27225]|uniref:hypothetical protein n=1 Tax=Bacillus sp. FJAT-27225 TaxID=1743144 RepID=UPI003F89096C
MKRFLVTIGAFLLVTGLLYGIGYTFRIPALMFKYEYTNDAEGFFVQTGSILPFLIGLAASYVAEKLYPALTGCKTPT